MFIFGGRGAGKAAVKLANVEEGEASGRRGFFLTSFFLLQSRDFCLLSVE